MSEFQNHGRCSAETLTRIVRLGPDRLAHSGNLSPSRILTRPLLRPVLEFRGNDKFSLAYLPLGAATATDTRLTLLMIYDALPLLTRQ